MAIEVDGRIGAGRLEFSCSAIAVSSCSRLMIVVWLVPITFASSRVDRCGFVAVSSASSRTWASFSARPACHYGEASVSALVGRWIPSATRFQ